MYGNKYKKITLKPKNNIHITLTRYGELLPEFECCKTTYQNGNKFYEISFKWLFVVVSTSFTKLFNSK